MIKNLLDKIVMKKHLEKQMFVCGHNQHDISEPVLSYGRRQSYR